MSVIAYRAFFNIQYCPDWEEQSPAYCFIVTTVCGSLLNAIFIVILGKVRDARYISYLDYSLYCILIFLMYGGLEGWGFGFGVFMR